MDYSGSDQHFRKFASSLEKVIAQHGMSPKEANAPAFQKAQIDELVRLEAAARTYIIAHGAGEFTYKAFIAHICDERANILDARPYFRERNAVFATKIGKVLKGRDWKKLQKFRFNYRFLAFVMQCRRWGKKSPLHAMVARIKELRTQLVELNMPLAISRARIFWGRTPRSQLSYMDLVQISAEGLMSAVDKFVPPYSTVFRAMIIGRITGNHIKSYSETLVHFYPADKRKLYWANKLSHKFAGSVDYKELAGQVSGAVDEKHKTSSDEIADIMAASSCVSADYSEHQPSYRGFAAGEEARPDVAVEREVDRAKLKGHIAGLTIFERKFLKLKGVGIK